MPRRIRHQDPDTWYFITNRCFQQRYLMQPDEGMNQIIRGCLAWAADKHDIELAFFLFMGNHYHLGSRFPHCNRQYFMRDFQRELARRGNNHREGRNGSFFEGRYKCEPILDTKAFWGRLTYTLNNPVEAGLVTYTHRWPGVSSLECHRTGKPFEGKFLNKTRMHELERKGDEHAFEKSLETYSVELTLPPDLQGETKVTAGERIVEAVEADRRQRLADKSRLVQRFGGVDDILDTHWSERPDSPKKSPEPLCHSSCPKKRQEYGQGLVKLTLLFKEASKKLRKGNAASFPAGTTPPGYHRCLKRRQKIQPARGP